MKVNKNKIKFRKHFFRGKNQCLRAKHLSVSTKTLWSVFRLLLLWRLLITSVPERGTWAISIPTKKKFIRAWFFFCISRSEWAVCAKKEKKGGKEKEAKQKMRTSLEHVETEFQLGWPHDTTLCLTWWFNVLWAFLGIDGLTSSIRVTSLEQLSVVEFSGE